MRHICTWPKESLFSDIIVQADEICLEVFAIETVRDLKTNSSVDDLKNFYENNCLNFFVESVNQIQNIFPLDDPIHSVVQCLDPKRAIINLVPNLLPICFYAISQIFEFVGERITKSEDFIALTKIRMVRCHALSTGILHLAKECCKTFMLSKSKHCYFSLVILTLHQC